MPETVSELSARPGEASVQAILHLNSAARPSAARALKTSYPAAANKLQPSSRPQSAGGRIVGSELDLKIKQAYIPTDVWQGVGAVPLYTVTPDGVRLPASSMDVPELQRKRRPPSGKQEMAPGCFVRTDQVCNSHLDGVDMLGGFPRLRAEFS